MKRTIQILVVLFIVQVGFAIGINFYQPQSSETGGDDKLVAAKTDKVDRVTIEDSDGAKVMLVKNGKDWQLPDQGNFPADSNKVDGLISKLADLHEGLPIATSSGAIKRFKLAKDDFERRITLAKGDQSTAVLYFGTSQGTHQIHARRDDQNEVYAVTMGSYDAPAKADDWIDSTALQVPADDIVKMDVDGLSLMANAAPVAKTDAKSADKTASAENADKADQDQAKTQMIWTLANATADQKLQPAAASTLAAMMAKVRISSVLGNDAKPEYGMDHPVLKLSLTIKGKDKPVDYLIGKGDGKEGDYTLKLSSRPEYFRIAGYTGKQLVQHASASALLVGKKDDEKTAPGSDSPASAKAMN
ncbi:DUF4340 domain-containing protein [Thalassospira sp. MCCC 1A01428]|uniref:DUF4340 domain-containing protein n=1 Tax=Thalassospira sp. MCCC 1A01428 TaxID=1470575 RepID=UPI000A1DBEF5|nr:DUF4340 domain-containing protein [Thalassospira sp. MCCC 1A01428]OSQ45084.1 hypothetical protein THS27_05205 [Thalassospira sp. MCCC 1A01428]